MSRKLSIAFLVLLIIAVCAAGYLYFREAVRSFKSPLSAVPGDVAVILEINDFRALSDRLRRETAYWDSLSAVPGFSAMSAWVAFLDTLYESNAGARRWLSEEPVYVSLHRSGSGKTAALCLANLRHSGMAEAMAVAAGQAMKGSKVRERTVNGVPVADVSLAGGRSFCFALTEGILVGSFTAHLVEDAIRQAASGRSLAHDASFAKVRSTSLRGADLNLYLNLGRLHGLLSDGLNEEHRDALDIIRGLHGWCEADISLKTDAVRLYGFASPKESGGGSADGGFYGMFRGPGPGPVGATRILPASTAAFLSFRTGDYPAFRSDSSSDETLKEWMGDNFGVAVVAPEAGGQVLFMHLRDPLSAQAALELVTEPVMTRNGYRIGRTGDSLFAALTGQAFHSVKASCFTVVDDYLALAEDTTALLHLIDRFEAESTLNKSIFYNNFSENLSPESNLSFYINIPRALPVLIRYAAKEPAAVLTLFAPAFNRFEAFSLQVSPDEGMLYTNAYLRYNPHQKSATQLLLLAENDAIQVELDAPVALRPAVMKNHYDGSREILVQDEANRLYLINAKGEMLWKRPLKERIVSDVYQVDRYRNGKLQYMFNTASAIYQVDRNGKDVANFPLTLQSGISNAIAVFDYGNDRNYRILAACNDKSVHNLNVEGRPVAGWVPVRPGDVIAKPFRHFVTGGKDYILTSDRSGRIYLLNRRGEQRAPVKSDAVASAQNDFYFDGKAKRFLTSDTTGNILSIGTSGDVQVIALPPAGSGHRLALADINGDGRTDFLLLDRNVLTAYGADREVLFEVAFDGQTEGPPLLFGFSASMLKTGVVERGRGKIHLLNDNGSSYPGFPLKGTTPFSIHDLDKDGGTELVTGARTNHLLIYRLPDRLKGI